MAPEEFENFINDNFENGEEIINKWRTPQDSNPEQTPIPKPKSLNRKIEAQDLGSVKNYYIGEPKALRQMEHKFKEKIVSASIYDLNTNKFVNASEKDIDTKLTKLNKNIADYKFELINHIRRITKTGDPLDIDYKLTGQEFSALIEQSKLAFENYDGEDKSEIYDDYVILSKFDDLIKQYAPFIETKKIYNDSTYTFIDQYDYKGPNVEHFTSFSSSDYADAFEQASDLSRILLDIFPELNANGEPINNTSISLEGFTSAMASLKQALQYPITGTILENLSHELRKGAEINMSDVLEKYINWILVDAKNVNDKRKSYLVTKLRAIKHYIYDSNLDQDIKDMFTAMFLKNVPVKYEAYQYDNESGKVVGKNLDSSLVNIQKYRLQDMISSSIALFQKNPEAYKAITTKWGITDDNKGTITIAPSGLNDTATINYQYKNGRYTFSTNDNFDEGTTKEIIRDLISYVVPDDYMNIYFQTTDDPNSLFKNFKDILGLVLLNNNPSIYFAKTQGGLFDFSSYHTLLDPIANILSILYGSDTISVIKNLEGNSVPTTQLINLAQNMPAMIDKIRHGEEDFEKTKGFHRFNIYEDNLILGNNSLIGQPYIRSSIQIGDRTKSPGELTTNELMQIAIVQDFYDKLKSGVIDLQATTFADKNTHFLIPFLINQSLYLNGNEFNFKEAIDDVLTTGNTSKLEQVYAETRGLKIGNIVNNIISDWKQVLSNQDNLLSIANEYLLKKKLIPQAFKTVQDLNNYITRLQISNNPIEVNLANKLSSLFNYIPRDFDEFNNFIADWELTVPQISQLFQNAGLDCFENIHYYQDKKSKKILMNETIYNWNRVFSDKNLIAKRLNTNRYNFIDGLFSNNVEFNTYKNTSVREWANTNLGQKWVDSNSGDLIYAKTRSGEIINKYNYKQFKGQDIILNPFLDAYYLTDTILSNEYMSLAMGEVYAHQNKNDEGTLYSDDYFEFSEANRLIAQNKRAVIMGATHHPFLQGMKYGVTRNIKIAVMNDMPGNVFNMFLDDKPVDSMDGSGLSSPLQARMENKSLLDSNVGYDKKTIMGDVDPIYGRPTLLKWAVYALTNSRRRLSRKSVASGEKLFAKMHNISIAGAFDVNKVSEWFNKQEKHIYYYDINTDTWKYIESVKVQQDQSGNYVCSRKIYNADKNGGGIIGESYQETQVYTPEQFTLYSLDQLFGGAYAGELDESTNKLDYAEKNLDVLMDIVCNENLKDKFIAYAVNKSAIKVGAGNINSVDKWTDDDMNLSTITMSTEFGGVQMNADHELDEAEVTEMTQMLSSLIENGNSLGIVNEIYRDIGNLVVEALADFNDAVETKDRSKMYRLLGEALIDAFLNNDRDTIGLAQSFIIKANKSLQDNNIEYKIPFSAPTINGAFISTITSLINKRGIRRKYAGFAGILTPSHNMIQYYRVNGITYSFDKLAQKINRTKIALDESNPWKTANIDQFIDEIQINGILNPYLELYKDINDVDFEDTVVLIEKNPPFGEPRIHTVYVDSWAIYDYLKHNVDLSEYNIYNWTSRPKNLKQSNTFFKIQGSNKQYSVYDTDAVRVSHYLKNKPTDKEIDLVKFLGYNDVVDDNRAKQIITDFKNEFVKSVYGESTTENPIDYNKLAEEDIREIYKAVEEGHAFKSSQVFNIDSPTVIATEYNVEPAEIIVGRMNAVKYGLTPDDDLSDITFRGSNFFLNKMLDRVEMPNVDSRLYDFVLYTEDGEQILVKYGNEQEIQQDFAKIGGVSQDSTFKVVGDKVYYNDEEFTSTNDKQFYTYTDEYGHKHNIITINQLDRLNELKNNSIIDLTRTNYKSTKWRELATYNQDELTKNPNFNFVQANQKQFIKEESKSLNWKLEKIAKRKYDDFQKSLYLVGARIPTQGMQSYMPMKVIMFTDSEVNDIYVPKAQTWLQGSDYWANTLL